MAPPERFWGRPPKPPEPLLPFPLALQKREVVSMTVVYSLLCLASVGVLLTTVQALFTCHFFRRQAAKSAELPEAVVAVGRSPRVSILKPLSGLEDGLEENLASFANLRGLSYEVILSVADRWDPALDVVRAVTQRFPESPFVVVVGGVTPGLVVNPKIERLIAASRLARGEIFFISDANVRVSPGDITQTISLFEDPSVGCVSNVFVGEGATSLGATLESLHLLTFVVPGTVLAKVAGATCVMGKSMAITRKIADRIGGFEAFANLLAEDQAIGLAVTGAGYRWALSPIVVRNVIIDHSLSQALNRQLRWGKIRYAFSRALYTAEFLANPLPLALLACGFAIFMKPQSTMAVSAFTLGVGLIRCLQAAILARAVRAELPWPGALLAPLQDLLQFCSQFVPFFSNEVNWRNHFARLGRGTVMLPSRRRDPDRASTRVPAEPPLTWGRP